MKKTIFLHKSIEVLVVSSGGVGTTFLMDAIAKYKKINTARKIDGYKHMPIPPLSFNKGLKVVYVFGDPIMASISLFRREYHHTQSRWVHKYHDPGFIIPQNMALDEYAANQKDGLLFEEHMDNWLNKYPVYPTIFVKYEELYNSLDALASFLDLPPSFLENFPKKRTRKSSVNQLSTDTIKGLQGIYASYQKEVNELPNYLTNNITKPKTINSFLFSKPYRRAFKEAFFRQFVLLRKIKNKVFGVSGNSF